MSRLLLLFIVYCRSWRVKTPVQFSFFSTVNLILNKQFILACLTCNYFVFKEFLKDHCYKCYSDKIKIREFVCETVCVFVTISRHICRFGWNLEKVYITPRLSNDYNAFYPEKQHGFLGIVEKPIISFIWTEPRPIITV